MRFVSASVAAIVAAGAAAAVLTACSGASDQHSAHTSTASAASAEVAAHNGDDVMFAQAMIPHHEQAVEMAQLALANTSNPDVVALANQIATAQLPEIQVFKTWLVQWKEPEAGHGGHDGIGMAGMVDPTTMDKLRSAHGPEFDKLWLQSMIGHHQGVIAMSQREAAQGQNQDVISVANSIISMQQAEIDKMKQLLGG